MYAHVDRVHTSSHICLNKDCEHQLSCTAFYACGLAQVLSASVAIVVTQKSLRLLRAKGGSGSTVPPPSHGWIDRRSREVIAVACIAHGCHPPPR